MIEGQTVTVRLYGGKTASRRVVAIKRDVIVVCVEEEYEAAKRDGRDPIGLGFPKDDVLDVANPRKGADSERMPTYRRFSAGD